MKSWDGGENAIDSAVVEGESRKRGRDSWDEELDKGKVGGYWYNRQAPRVSDGRTFFVALL